MAEATVPGEIGGIRGTLQEADIPDGLIMLWLDARRSLSLMERFIPNRGRGGSKPFSAIGSV